VRVIESKNWRKKAIGNRLGETICNRITVLKEGSASACVTQNRHARARSYHTVAGIDDLAVKVSSLGSAQKIHDLCRLGQGTERLAFKIADLVHAVGAIEYLHLSIDNARQ
jgi:hypothetical protein